MEDYWSTNPLIETQIFSKTMSRNRFRQILTYIHFANNANTPTNGNRLFKIQYLIDYFSKKIEENFNLSQNICIDEGMIPWRGRLNFNTYNPSKIIKYGILIRMLCDSATRYILSFKLYCGVGQSLNTTIMELLRRSFGKWHHFYMDNLYNSVVLAKELLFKQIRVCGTIRRDRELPDSLKNAKLKRSETLFKRQEEILLQLWQTLKNRVVRMISTIHNAEFVDSGKICRKTGRAIQKPGCIFDYNQHMKGVDRADQYLSYYPIFRKTLKWFKKVALYLFNCGLLNAFKVYRHMNESCGKTREFRDFLLRVARYWIQHRDIEGNFTNPTTSTHHHQDPLHRLSGNLKHHQLITISPTNIRKRRRCHICYSHRKRKTTRFMCKTYKFFQPKKCLQIVRTAKCFFQNIAGHWRRFIAQTCGCISVKRLDTDRLTEKLETEPDPAMEIPCDIGGSETSESGSDSARGGKSSGTGRHPGGSSRDSCKATTGDPSQPVQHMLGSV
ncbi:PREDICTED: piggyBac transposable element-derived protein 4-like [Polistes dominula]|uniref:PiggyBac transposable element-derived protein 4-like n=1 Tax=Polistes dominula TaxID=743375 RepID=A0ABM1JB14_POLDO|nr:PREDICTED: piggyBac transposable element-derived protein 4-like [Polistes dominula]